MAFVPSLERAPSPRAHRVYLIGEAGVVMRVEAAAEGAPPLLTEADADALGVDVQAAHPLGVDDGVQVVAAALPSGTSLPSPYRAVTLREAWGILGEAEFAVAGRATQIVEWATTHRYCGRCSTPTSLAATERCVVCPACGLRAFPRVAPAVIVLVRKGEEALLARNARFPEGRYSTLAGFSEPGESLEETIAREIKEEAGIDVTNPRYFGSQPWPFPHSLMVGFTASWSGGEIQPDGEEIVDAQWFRADDLPKLPPPMSIARQLIESWKRDVLGVANRP